MVFSQEKPLLAIFTRPQYWETALTSPLPAVLRARTGLGKIRIRILKHFIPVAVA